MIEVLKQAYQLLLTEPHAPTVCDQLEVILRQAIAGLESQEPVAWMKPDVLCDRACMYLCTKGFTQFPECANVPPQLERNFCSRCGKRTNDIHTCTPPQD